MLEYLCEKVAKQYRDVLFLYFWLGKMSSSVGDALNLALVRLQATGSVAT